MFASIRRLGNSPKTCLQLNVIIYFYDSLKFFTIPVDWRCLALGSEPHLERQNIRMIMNDNNFFKQWVKKCYFEF